MTTTETVEWTGPTRYLPPPEPAQREDGVLHYSGVTYAVAFGYRPLQLDLWVSAAAEAPALVVWVHGGAGCSATGGTCLRPCDPTALSTVSRWRTPAPSPNIDTVVQMSIDYLAEALTARDR